MPYLIELQTQLLHDRHLCLHYDFHLPYALLRGLHLLSRYRYLYVRPHGLRLHYVYRLLSRHHYVFH